MIIHKRPGVNYERTCFTKLSNAHQEIFPIRPTLEYFRPFNPPGHNMVQGPGASSLGCLGITITYTIH